MKNFNALTKNYFPSACSVLLQYCLIAKSINRKHWKPSALPAVNTELPNSYLSWFTMAVMLWISRSHYSGMKMAFRYLIVLAINMNKVYECDKTAVNARLK